MRHDVRTAEATLRGRSFVAWGAIFAGALVGVAVMALWNSMWFAFSVGPGTNWVATNLGWFVGGTAIFSMLLAGFLAGWWAGGRGPVSGLVHGLTEWGLVTVAAVVAVPGLVGVVGGIAGTAAGAAFWTAFWSLLVGLGAALLGGLLGGSLPAPGARQAATEVRDLKREDRAA